MKIINKPTATKEQVYTWLDGIETHHPLCKGMVELFFEIAPKEGVDPIVAIAQAMKETGHFNFKGVLKPNFCNTCGLKNSKGGGDTDPDAHHRFDYWEDGILAHVEHLALYAGAPGYPKANPMDPRHFDFLLGKCPNVEDLSGNWAPGSDYGTAVVRICQEIIDTIPKPEDATKEEYEDKIMNLQHDLKEAHQQIDALKDKAEKYDTLKKSVNDLF